MNLSALKYMRYGAYFVCGMALSFHAAAADAVKPGKQLIAQYDYPPGYTTEVFRTTVAPHAQAPQHMHPGIESGYILQGGGTLYVDGQPPKKMKPGTTNIVPPETRHWFINGDKESVMISTYVVEKNKPLMTVISKK